MQILTVGAVLIGLAFVVWELQQTRTLTRLQLTSDAYSEVSADRRTLLGENFAETFAKACVGAELSQSETVEMISHLDLRIGRIRRARDVDRVERSSAATWEELAVWNLRAYLSIPLGRSEYDKNRGDWDPEFREIAKKVIQDGVSSCSERWLLNLP